jgi:hypothetical protein
VCARAKDLHDPRAVLIRLSYLVAPTFQALVEILLLSGGTPGADFRGACDAVIEHRKLACTRTSANGYLIINVGLTVCVCHVSSVADLAHAWGREKGFHHHMSALMCERRGDLERKVRSDRGRDRSSVEPNKRGLDESAAPPSCALTANPSTGASGRPSKRPHRSDGASPSEVTGMVPGVDLDLLGTATGNGAVL